MHCLSRIGSRNSRQTNAKQKPVHSYIGLILNQWSYFVTAVIFILSVVFLYLLFLNVLLIFLYLLFFYSLHFYIPIYIYCLNQLLCSCIVFILDQVENMGVNHYLHFIGFDQ